MPSYITTFQSSPVRIWKTVKQSLEEVVKSGAGSLRTEFATEELHAEESEDEDEENEEDEQGDDGGDGVHEGLDQAAHGFPVLRDFEGSQKTDAPHNRETHGWHNLKFDERVF